MAIRKQAALQFKQQQTPISPLRTYPHTMQGRVIDVHYQHGTMDIALERGPILREVPLTIGGAGASTKAGTTGLPQVWNTQGLAFKNQQTGRIYDEAGKTHKYDTFALVTFIDSYSTRPVVTGLMNPNSHQLSFFEPNLEMNRKTSDIYEVYWTEAGIDIRPPPFGQGSGEEELTEGNYQIVFPDRNRDLPVGQHDPPTFGNDRQTYLSFGYHDTPRQFGDGTTSSNFDTDMHPWQNNQTELGDDLEKLKYARGITFNQRFRSRFSIDTLGNIDIHSEGRGFDSTSYKDKTTSQGTIQFWSRLETRTWNKHFATWTRMRPRFDGKDPESEDTAKKTGTWQLRTQKFIDIASRKDIEVRTRDTLTVNVGDFDSKWSGGDAGEDPGTHWDDKLLPGDLPALNKNFKNLVADDHQWKDPDNLWTANVTFHYRRPSDAKATGPQTFVWTMDPQKANTDADWTLTLQPVSGNTLQQITHVPSAGKSADFNLDLNQPANPVSLHIHTDATAGKVTLTVQGPSPCGMTLDAATGVVNITGTALEFNGVAITVP